MSGYWEAPIDFARVAQQISEAAAVQRELEGVAEALADNAAQIAKTMSSQRPNTPEFRSRVVRLQTEIAAVVGRIASARREAAAVAIPDRAYGSSEAAMSGVLGQLSAQRARFTEVRGLLEAASREHAEMTLQDTALVNARLALMHADSTLRANREAVDRWLPGERSPFSGAIATGLREIAESVSREDSEHAAATGALAAQVARQVEELVARADELEAQQQRRMYTLKGLREVCARLGFEEVQAPNYENGQPGNPVVFTVDTRGRGRIAFRIGLDSRIETDSKMNPSCCEREFGRLAASLGEQFGIKAQFTDLHVTARPDLRTWDAKDVPQGDRELSADK